MSMYPNEGQKSMFPIIKVLEKELEKFKKENKELQQQLKNCNLQNVSNRRELLIAFSQFLETCINCRYRTRDENVDKFLSN